MIKSVHIAAITLLLGLLIGVTSIVGLSVRDFYASESFNWQIQSRGQDLLNAILILPALGVSALLLFMGFRWALPLWAGTVLYLAYTYVIYCFGLHFNVLFIIYCAVLGISSYTFLAYLDPERKFFALPPSPAVRKTTAVYFIVIALVFAFLWLSDILNAIIHHTIPASVRDAGLASNPVHILDLSLFLPGLAIIGVLALKTKSRAVQLMPSFLMFCILMDLTIAGLSFYMGMNDLPASMYIPAVMLVLALFSAVLLVLNLRTKNIQS